MDEVKEEKIEFKKPVLFGRIGKLPKKVKSEADHTSEVIQADKAAENICNASPSPPAVIKEILPPVPYKEPKWSGLCPEGSEYALDVLKSGMIVDKVELTSKAYFVFGRLNNCDVVMGHPTVSRHHAILQYKAFATEGEPPAGWYLFDLNSTHGTFLNRERLKANHYTRVRVGHQIKFGNSSRTHIVSGPDFDCEGESELTVTEIKKRAEHMKQERDRMIQEAVEQRERQRLVEEKKREEQGIDWGMGEDAEEEPDLADNPYAVAANEELYLTDPKKTLRGYCEREGHELNYDCEERGVGQFLCRVELPLDDAHGRPVVAQVLHRGSKKETVKAAALEACRVLDRAGLLRRATHEPRGKKRREYDPENYSDSDDDTFLDRTGAVEKKRAARMRGGPRGKGLEGPLTYDALLEQVSSIEAKLSSEERALERLRAPPPEAEAEGDALDEYMRQLGRQTMAHKANISKTKMSIQKLKGELNQVRRLAEVARPAHLPPLEGARVLLKQTNSVVYGKRIKLKDDADRKSKKKVEIKKEESEFVEEMDSDEDDKTRVGTDDTRKVAVEEIREAESAKVEGMKETEDGNTTSANETKDTNTISANGTVDGITSAKEPEIPVRKSAKDAGKMYGPMRPPEDYVIPENYFDQETERDLPEILEKDD